MSERARPEVEPANTIAQEEVQEHLRTCHHLIDLLASAVRTRVRHWSALPQANQRLIAYARQSSEPVAADIIAALTPYTTLESLNDLEALTAMVRVGKEMLARTRTLSGYDQAGSLWLAAHSTIEQYMGMALPPGADPLQENVRQLLTDLSALPPDILQSHDAPLRAALPTCAPETLSRPHLDALAHLLEMLALALPQPARSREKRVSIPSNPTQHFRIAIIEDEEAWQEFVLQAVRMVRKELDSRFRLETVCFDNVTDARRTLLSDKAALPTSVQTLAVVDMGLPLDARHREAIRDGKSTPDRNNGHALLRDLRAYRANIPCIVLTVPPQLLSDQMRACEQGVEDMDYIRKGPDKHADLVQAILRIISLAQRHRIEARISPQYAASVDGIPVPLADMPFRTFHSLCSLSRDSRSTFYTSEQILSELEQDFGDVFEYLKDPETSWEKAQALAADRGQDCWPAAWHLKAANVIHTWAAYRQQFPTGPTALTETLLAFRRHSDHLWRNAHALLFHYIQTHPESGPWAGQNPSRDHEVPAPWIDAVFGGLQVDSRSDYDLENIKKHVQHIREAIHQAFQAAHRFVEPQEIVVSGQAGEGYGYRIQGDITLEALPEDDAMDDEEAMDLPGLSRCRTSAPPCTVLLVEDTWDHAERMRSLLKSAGFQVETAASVEEGIQKALACRPDILSLDMHLPHRDSAVPDGSLPMDAMGGLQVLESVRQALPDVKVMCPTTSFDGEEIRERAARLKVPIANFVPKGGEVQGGSWEGYFLLTATRLRKELREGVLLPAAPGWKCPIIQVLPKSDLSVGILNLLVNGRQCQVQKGKQGLLLSLLLRHAEEMVSYEEIDTLVNGGPATEDARKGWIKNIRAKIQQQWLGLPLPSQQNNLEETPAERANLEVLESVPGGLILHVHVEGPLPSPKPPSQPRKKLKP